jgi:branched-chain amino acid transport system ATP-binding protein
MKSILNITPPHVGRVEFMGKSLEKIPTHKIVKLGISYIPEGREIFPNMTVLENLEMGAYSLSESRKETKNKIGEIYEMFSRLSERKSQKAGSLSGGEQQMCAIGRALMSAPKVLLIDELSLGLAPVVIDELLEIIKCLQKEGMSILLVEQDVQTGLDISDRAYVLEHGRIVMQDASSNLKNNSQIKESYLGI